MKTNPDVDTLKQLTIDARNLAKYLKASNQVQALDKASIDIESALIEAQRVNCLNIAADLVNQASQMEQTIAKLYMNWKRISNYCNSISRCMKTINKPTNKLTPWCKKIRKN